jgi:tetratricopeptide (TPR) repeat protein
MTKKFFIVLVCLLSFAPMGCKKDSDDTKNIEGKIKNLTLFNQVQELNQKRMFDKSISVLQDYIANTPESSVEPFAYELLAEANLQTRRYDEALRICNRVLEKDKDTPHPNIFLFRGRAYSETGKRNEALADFSQAIKLDSKNPWYYYYRGMEYILAEDYSQSIEDFKQAIRIKPRFGNFYTFMAFSYMNLGNWDLAKDALEKADMYCLTKISQYKNWAAYYWANPNQDKTKSLDYLEENMKLGYNGFSDFEEGSPYAKFFKGIEDNPRFQELKRKYRNSNLRRDRR